MQLSLKQSIWTVFCLSLASVSISYAASAPQPYVYNGHSYYVVSSQDPTGDTGAKVCAKVGKPCVGYTAYTLDVCKYFHPDASATVSVNGSKAGFYCNGAPQTGLACGTAINNCQVCPACNVNADCNFQISGLFREMYVECGAPALSASPALPTPSVAPSFWKIPAGWWNNFHSFFSNWWHSLRSRFSQFSFTQIQRVTVTVQGPNGVTASATVPPDSVVCDFYQIHKKLVTCGAYQAANTFCAIAMQSRFARAVLCQDNGVILCTNPCHPSEHQVPITHCAFDADRSRGSQAAPLNFCN